MQEYKREYPLFSLCGLNLRDLKDIMTETNEIVSKQNITLKDKIKQIALLFEAQASKDNIELKLRK
ncbi:MAG: hypothetical protein A4E53_01093 [Pelotomaculum sp. PtaB.Bin104]|nr:MAG: hypothetical protein A4E53_01093 [Pelotomaculum sp. PtaB.Bin104]